MKFTIMMDASAKSAIESWRGKGPYGSKIVGIMTGKATSKNDLALHDVIAVKVIANPITTWYLKKKLNKCATIFEGHPRAEELLMFGDFKE